MARGVTAFARALLGSSVARQLHRTVGFPFVGNVIGTSATATPGMGTMALAACRR